MFVLVILAYLIIGIIEIIPLYKKKKNNELLLYSFIFLFAFIISMLLSFGVKIPSPAKYIEKIIKTFVKV